MRLFCIVSYSSVLNVKVLVGAFNQEKALVWASTVIVKTDGSMEALLVAHTSRQPGASAGTGKGKWRVVCCQLYSLERGRIGNVW